MKQLLLNDKKVLNNCKKHHRNLPMGRIDYKKVYDMVLHRWLVEAMKMVGIVDNIVNLFKKRKRHGEQNC